MDSKIDLNDMMLFIAVVDAGSFTKAADWLAMPKANLSRKVSRLEDRLGITLLERTTRAQNLTEAGHEFLAHCRRIKLEVDLAEASVEKVLNRVEGQLRVGASVGIGHELLKPTLGQFMLDYPDVNLQLSLMNQRVDLIEEGYDMVIRIGELEDSRLIAKRLGKIQRKVYASPKYLEKNGLIEYVEELPQHDMLLMSSIQSRGKVQLECGNKSLEFQVAPKMMVDDFHVLKQMALDGVGVAIIPTYMCEKDVQDGELIPLLEDWGMPIVEVYALYPRHRLNIPKVKVFMEYVSEVFERF
ncbi:LysR family transcriptional regulator [Vibrio sp. 10N.261.55.A7]|uniref:LysR family transcriptional regulator n=1 Tax=Vibrio sp. 10N.261.55.A7 TaxID=1880851 RepID=UPI0018E485D9|nr:LysR family transcriptional regulator [Vibrio sp. 10N.261.55.A7]